MKKSSVKGILQLRHSREPIRDDFSMEKFVQMTLHVKIFLSIVRQFKKVLRGTKQRT